MFARWVKSILVGGFLSVSMPLHAAPIVLDLNLFFADPTVTVNASGTSATMAEDAFLGAVILSNDPGLGDPVLFTPQVGAVLSFDYAFGEPTGNDDRFLAHLLDGAGGSPGPAYEFSVMDPGSGSVSFNLDGLVGQTLGLHFQLETVLLGNDSAFTSTVTVSNVTVTTAQVPEPATFLMLLSGFLGLGWGRQLGSPH